jgi:hypothetical protein
VSDILHRVGIGANVNFFEGMVPDSGHAAGARARVFWARELEIARTPDRNCSRIAARPGWSLLDRLDRSTQAGNSIPVHTSHHVEVSVSDPFC